MREILGGRYGVDLDGVIYSLRNNAGNRRAIPMPIRTKQTREGYFTCGVYQDTDAGVTRHSMFVHRLVALAYIPNPDDKPQVNHLDGDKGNNAPTNLEWVTAQENANHAYALGLRTPGIGIYKGKFNEEHPKSRAIRQLTLDGQVIREFPSAQEARRHGFSQGNISSVIAGLRKTHKGFRWEFAT